MLSFYYSSVFYAEMMFRTEKSFNEKVCGHIFSWFVLCFNFLLVVPFSDEVVPGIDMFSPRMLDGVFDQKALSAMILK
jgi:hypothetical protein